MSYSEIKKCRISGSETLLPVLDLGQMALTGVFPKTADEKVTTGPLGLVFCPDSGLLQLKQSYSLDEMYGDNYGYRSGLNASMVNHLQEKVKYLQTIKPIDAESTVLDIGGNDGTLLKAYEVAGLRRICIDPTVEKWSEYYAGTDIEIRPGFFGYLKGMGYLAEKWDRMDIITTIACFYDLQDPRYFVQEIARVLKPEGIWHVEMSYLPAMLKANAYDTICHEHLEYYSLRTVMDLLAECGLKVIDVQFNNVNGGSFAVTAAHKGSKHQVNTLAIGRALAMEPDSTEGWMAQFERFAWRTGQHREQLQTLIKFLNDEGKTVAGLGASTKGNVILQWCGFTSRDIQFISDVNPEKWDRITPGSHIPIVDESWAKKLKPDYMLVLPWHFREGIIQREREFLEGGGRLLFPLPDIEIVDKSFLL